MTMPAPQHDAKGIEEHRVLHVTTSLCRGCKNGVPARVVALPDNTVWMVKRCPEHGASRVMLSNNAEWYERTRAISPVPNPPEVAVKPVEHGCPFDCGPCESHQQKIKLPVVTITSACNLDCPICYVFNKNRDPYHMSREEFADILAHLKADHPGETLDLINFTGGDPTMHPNFLDFIEMAHEAGIHRVSLCTNGIKLAKDEGLVERLAQIGGRVALSFDSFDDEPDFAMQGATLVKLKMKVLALLEKHAVNTTLIPVMTRGMNDHEIGRMIQLGLDHSCVRHIEVHTITYTGMNGADFNPDRSGRISLHEVLECIEDTTDGALRISDFVPSPCAHPLCYQIAYLLLDPEGGPPVPFTRFMSRETLYACLADHLYLEPSPTLERAFQDAITELWAGADDDPEAERILGMLRHMLHELFPRKPIPREEALARSEQVVKAVYVHSHMDEDTFDVERAAQCCDSNCYVGGKTIPVCNSNVLFREKNLDFNETPATWNARLGGQKHFPGSSS